MFQLEVERFSPHGSDPSSPFDSTSSKKLVGRIGVSINLDYIARRQLSASSRFNLAIDPNFLTLNHQFRLPTCSCNSSQLQELIQTERVI